MLPPVRWPLVAWVGSHAILSSPVILSVCQYHRRHITSLCTLWFEHEFYILKDSRVQNSWKRALLFPNLTNLICRCVCLFLYFQTPTSAGISQNADAVQDLELSDSNRRSHWLVRIWTPKTIKTSWDTVYLASCRQYLTCLLDTHMLEY